MGIDDAKRGKSRFSLNANGQVQAVRQQKTWESQQRFVHLFGYDSELNLNQQGFATEYGDSNVVSLDDARVKRQSRQYDKAGRVLDTGRFRYHYDKCGRVVEKTEYKDGFRPKTTRFVWNGDDRLTHIELPDGGRYRYRYDPLGRRVAKECLSTQRITEYLWDGANIVQHSQKTADGSVIQEIEYLYEPETFRPLAQVTHKADQASQLHYIVTDHAGTPQELCSENGEVVWQGEQTLWGHYQQRNALPNHGFRENAQNDELYCDLRYQGQIEDRESGLYYNVNRYYDADSGQYLSPDPIGFAGGLRPQAYVFNPLEWVDPLGLTPFNQGGFSVYGLYESGASKPYYVGLSNNPDTRGLQHLESGRLSGNSQLRVLKDDLNYSQARGYEQAYIEKCNTKTGTIGEPISSANKGNKINSFDKNRTDPRGQAFNDEYQKANQDINGNTKGKSCG